MVTDAEPILGYDAVTNTYTCVSTAKPSSHTIVKQLFHEKTYKLRDLAKKLNLTPSKVFKVMFDRNTEEADKLDERIVSTGENVWAFKLGESAIEAPILPDTTKPMVISAVVLNNILTITFEDVNHLDASKVPTLDKFGVSVNGTKMNVQRIQLGKNSNVLKLYLGGAVKFGDIIEVQYTKPDSPKNSLQDTAKNIIDNFQTEVNNLSEAPPAPEPAPVTPTVTDPQTPPAEDPPAAT